MRRWTLFPLVVVMLVAAGCIPGPPPGWVAPIVGPLVVSPDPVVAGSAFTVSVTASDDSLVDQLDLEIRPPYRLNSATDPAYPHVTCDGTPFTPQPVVTREFTCTLPTFVPNGAWRVSAFAGDNQAEMYGGSNSTTFQLIGGSEDREDPVLVSEAESPSPVVVGQPFTVTVQVSDEHPGALEPTELTFANSTYGIPDPPPRVVWWCEEATPTQVTPTLQEWVFTCLIGPDAVLGSYGGFMQVKDAIGHELAIWSQIDVVAAP